MLDDPRARRAALDAVAPRHPVWLAANTGHGVIVNTAALRALGIPEEAADPAGGFYEREGAPYPGRGRGRLTGLLHEYAGWNAARGLRSGQPDRVLVAALRRHAERALAAGITSIQDMANATDAATTLRVLRLARLPVRVRVVPMPGTDATERRAGEWPAALRDSAWRASAGERLPTGGGVAATKWILDGTGIERLSLLRAPYADRPAWSGEINFPPDTLRALLREALAGGEQPVLHVIGDGTIAVVLSAMEALAPDSAWRRLRPRFEHAEWLTPDLRPHARRLGVVVVENPLHFTDGPARMAARFGAARAREYQPFRSILDAAIPLAIGSDGPTDPFLDLLLATTHPDNPREALTREQAVVAYTRGGAYAEHAERAKGTLAPGMLADLAVLSQDVFTVPAAALPTTVSVLTVVGGKVAYDAGGLVDAGRAGAPR
jgi:predicted amidohydrolase YtcJ